MPNITSLIEKPLHNRIYIIIASLAAIRRLLLALIICDSAYIKNDRLELAAKISEAFKLNAK